MISIKNIDSGCLKLEESRNEYDHYFPFLQAWNSQGPGPISEPVEIFTAEDMPQVQPTEVSAFAHNATSLNVTWQPIEPTRENIRGKLIGYRVSGLGEETWGLLRSE